MATAQAAHCGSKLRALRDALKLTRRNVADRVGADISTVQRWERGEARPSTEHVAPLARLYGMSSDRLLKMLAGAK